MSGFEVVGIVLGAVPLAIAALEYTIKGLSALQRWRQYERELRRLIRNLQTEQVKLQNVCEKLLVGLVPNSQIESMIDNPLGDVWREAETKRRIRARLWRSFDIFEATMGDIKSAVDEMTRKIDSQRDGMVSELRRGVFTLKRSTYSDILSTIRDGISNLENLTDRNIELEQARRVRSQGKLWKILRDMSKSLYRALGSSLDCTCKHDIGLRLERRSADINPVDGDEESIGDLAFQLAVSYTASTSNDETDGEGWQTWQGILVKTACTPKAWVYSPTVAAVAAVPSSFKKGRAKRTVRFRPSQPAALPTTTDVRKPISALTMGVASIGLAGLAATLNLCEKLQRRPADVDSYWTIMDQQPQITRRYTVCPIPTTAKDDPRTESVISLRDVLEQKDHFLLSYRVRLQLAVVISSSVLQLYGTPWLPDVLSSRSIFFINSQNVPMYEHPVLIKNLPDSNPPATEDHASPPFGRNPTLLSLGFILIELILGRTLDSLRAPEAEPTGANLMSDCIMSDYITAHTVLDRVRMTSLNYGSAVTRCMDGDLHGRGSPGLDSEDICQDVYSGIVALLEKDLENA